MLYDIGKQKSSSKILGNSSNKRWFTIESIQGEEYSFSNCNHNYQDNHNPDDDDDDSLIIINSNTNNHRTNIHHLVNEELALCYYKTPSSKDRSGWVFLSDVTNIREEFEQVGTNTNSWIQVIHPMRVFKLRGINHRDHLLWLTTLREICNHGMHGDDDIEKDNEGSSAAALEERQSDENSLLGGWNKRLEPARATYQGKQDLSYNTKHVERDHEAEIDFIRQLTSSSKKNDDSPCYNDTYHHHNNKLIELESKGEENAPFSPTYHEIITKSGIEQHILLPSDESSFTFNKLLDEDAKTAQNTIQNVSNISDDTCNNVYPMSTLWNDDQNESKNNQHITNSIQNIHDEIDEEESKSTSTPVMKNDHRLDQNTNANDADEPIHKRLGRAILSNHEDDPEEKNIFVCNNVSNKHCHERNEQEISVIDSNDVAAITMVEQVSFDNKSTGSTEDSFVTSNTKLDQITDDGEGKEDMTYFQHNQIQLGDISFENDVLSLNHNHNNKGIDDFVPPDKDFMINDWDKEQNSNSEAKQEENQGNVSFETNCSFLPDSNFVDEDWDS